MIRRIAWVTDAPLKIGGLYNISYYLGTDGLLTNGAAMWVVIGTYLRHQQRGHYVDRVLPQFTPAPCRTRNSAPITCPPPRG